MIWNPFAVSTVEEATSRLQNGLEKLRETCLGGAATEAKWAEEAFDFIGRLPEDTVRIARGIRAPRWYRGMTHINLPDGHVGYAILNVEGTSITIQTSHGTGIDSGNL
jgi:hypothetical protein